MAQFGIGSWNIRNFSAEHANNPILQVEQFTPGVFTQLSVRHLLARQALAGNPDMLGIMEVTLGNGKIASEILRDAMNEYAVHLGPHMDFKVFVSDRNVATKSKKKVVGRAERYSLIINGKVFSTQFRHEFADGYGFSSRMPLRVEMELLSTNQVIDIVLWHAPNPEQMKLQAGSELEALEDFINDIRRDVGNRPMVVAGDFNVDSASMHFDVITDLDLSSEFEGVATMVRSADELYKQLSKLLEEQLAGTSITVEDVANAMLGNAYDNMFVGDVHGSTAYRLNLPLRMSTLRDANPSDPLVNLLLLKDNLIAAAAEARALSDHCPIFVTLTI